MAGKWWVCTDALARGGAKVIGPFESQELALDVRHYVEHTPFRERPPGVARQQATFWVDEEVGGES
jgi:hypothetical protein